MLLGIVGDELMTVRATAWDYAGVEAELERVAVSFRLTQREN